LIEAKNAVVTNEQPAIGLQPSEGALDFPSSAIAAKLSSVLPPPTLSLPPMRNQQLDAAPVKPIPQWIRVIGSIGDDALGPLPWSSPSPTGNPYLRERGFRQRDLCRRSARQLRSQRNALAIDSVPSTLSPSRAWFFPQRRLPFWQPRSCRPGRSRPTATAGGGSLRTSHDNYRV